MCCKSAKFDIHALIDRLGLFGCSDCKTEDRDRRWVFFTVVPDYAVIEANSNREWKPTFERGFRDFSLS
jgi:hypothetical protein